ncbi:MAG: hypothetical protein ABIT01_13785 [Thermoanaerobaculia bacterium]
MKKSSSLFALVLFFAAALPARAGFPGTDVVIVATARAQGGGTPPAQFYSTLWVTNLSASQAAVVKISLLKQGQANPAPLFAADQTLQPGETKKYENVLNTLFSLTSGSGALHLTSNVPVLASSRTYDQPDGSDIKDAKGLFFGAIPVSFGIGVGETAYLQGVSQGGTEDYRYNYGLVEVSGLATSAQPLKVRVTLKSASGASLATTDTLLAAYEARQWKASDLFPEIATTNARIEATVISGSGRAMLYGTSIANGSQDSAGFEMSFKDGLLSGSQATSTEDASGSTTASITAAVKTSYDVAGRLGTGTIAPPFGAPPFGAQALGSATLVDPISGDYDAVTGFWSVSVNLATGQSANLQVRFKDQSGTIQKFYGPLTTSTIESKGTAAGAQGALTWDFVVTGVRSTSSILTASGSGSGTYQGTGAAVTITTLAIPKSVGSWPTGGTVAIVSNGITVTITFNGTQYATGTYRDKNQSVTFTINLATGEVTR